jgi:hypothetical protein
MAASTQGGAISLKIGNAKIQTKIRAGSKLKGSCIDVMIYNLFEKKIHKFKPKV